MTVTFRAEVANFTYLRPNEEFNPSEPEDRVFNPRTFVEDLRPQVNFSNVNTANMLDGVLHPDDMLQGMRYPEDLPEFISLLERSKDKVRSTEVIKLCKICILNNWKLSWS
jgi:hypothetical protein